ncbi:MAG: site-specific integrase [Chitinophagaceae bacterium]
MNINVTKRLSSNKQKEYYSLEWGKGSGQRISTGIFSYVKPKDQLQRNHNKEAQKILETKRSQMILDRQAINSGYIPQHKLKVNFMEYYEEFVKLNSRKGNRHLSQSLRSFKKFVGKDYLSPIDINETFCERFRSYLLAHLNGETPANYFSRFKRVLEAAKKDGYFKNSPADSLASKAKPNKKVKDILEVEEYTKLMNTPCINHEVKKAFVFSLYTGFRWVDVKPLRWEDIKKDEVVQIDQKKTGEFLDLPLHPIALKILGERKTGLVFKLPTANGANKILGEWCDAAGLDKHITWHCARHSFSVLLQDKGTDIATVAGMLGHTSTKYVHKTYKRYRKPNALEAINKLPSL